MFFFPPVLFAHICYCSSPPPPPPRSIKGLVWQLMREHVIQTLLSLSKSGVSITDQDIISWANSAVKRGGKNSSISQFKDPALRSGVYLLDLLNGIKKGIVNYELVTGGMTGQWTPFLFFFPPPTKYSFADVVAIFQRRVPIWTQNMLFLSLARWELRFLFCPRILWRWNPKW